MYMYDVIFCNLDQYFTRYIEMKFIVRMGCATVADLHSLFSKLDSSGAWLGFYLSELYGSKSFVLFSI